TVGVLATVFPGVRYGYVMEKLDQDFRVPNERRRYGVTRKLTSEGWALSPTGWLTLTWQTDHPTYKTSGLEGAGKGPGATIRRFGCEVKLAPLGAVRLGSINGERTWGATLNLWRNRIHWVQADGQMPEIVQGQWPAGQYEAVHAYGWSLGL
ncbi:MAG TPA: hypothetical protein VEI97_15300, partial [bacterium]|nr:hypothetical protein [bacterium]